MSRSKRGFGLVELTISMGIIMVLAAALAVNVVKRIEVAESETAASELQRIDYAESAYQTLFGCGYAAPSVLSTLNQSQPITAANPGILTGMDGAMSVEGYQLAFIPGPTSTGCSVTTYQSYTITATPNISTMRDFLLAQDGTIRFNGGAPATATSPIYPLSLPSRQTVSTLIVGTSTGTGGTGGQTTPITTTPYSGMLTVTSSSCGQQNQDWGYNVGTSSSASISGSFLLDANGNIVQWSFPTADGNSGWNSGSGIGSSEPIQGTLLWYQGQTNDGRITGNEGNSVVYFDTNSFRGSASNEIFFGGVAVFSNNFQSFSWTGTLSNNGSGGNVQNCGTTITLAMHQ